MKLFNRVKKLSLKKIRFKQSQLAFPYAALIAIFVLVPLVVMLIVAFRGTDGGFTFKNFSSLFANGSESADTWKRIGVTFLLALCTTVVCLIISYPLSLALCTLRVNKRAILIMLFVAPMWINSLLRLYAIKLIFADVKINSNVLMVIGMVYDFLPFMMLPVYTSMANADKSYFEAANDLGSSPFRTLFTVKLSLTRPGIVSGAIMVFMPAMSSFAVNVILGGNVNNLLGNMIADRVSGGSADPVGSAYSLILLVIMGLTFFIANRYTKIQSKGEGVL